MSLLVESERTNAAKFKLTSGLGIRAPFARARLSVRGGSGEHEEEGKLSGVVEDGLMAAARGGTKGRTPDAARDIAAVRVTSCCWEWNVDKNG